MPSTRIETCVGWISGRQAELLEAVQAALIEGIRIPQTDRCVRLHELPAEAMLVPPDRRERNTGPENIVVIVRSVDAFRRPDAALMRLLDGFGVALSSVDRGFQVEV